MDKDLITLILLMLLILFFGFIPFLITKLNQKKKKINWDEKNYSIKFVLTRTEILYLSRKM